MALNLALQVIFSLSFGNNVRLTIMSNRKKQYLYICSLLKSGSDIFSAIANGGKEVMASNIVALFYCSTKW